VVARSVIVAGARTPIGRFRGGLAPLQAVDLGAIAIREAVGRAGLDPSQVDYTIMGHVIQAGAGQITARQAAIRAGIPLERPAITVNKVCLSGMSAVAIADQMIRAGEIEVAVAGGMESMTNAPYVLPQAREGSRLGHTPLIDAMIHDGLWCAFDDRHMGAGTDAVNEELGISRTAQDGWAVRSHRLAAAGWGSGALAEEVTAVEVPRRRGDPGVIERDEGIRPDTTEEALAGLRPAFTEGGTVTAGNASQISDGAAAVVVTSRAKADELGVTPLAELIGYGMVAGPDPSLLTQPSRAIKRALEGIDMTVSDVDLFELNEAFAAVGIASMRDLGITDDVVNVNGGAIALGHPIGMSGARVVLTLVNELRRRGGGTGAAALCGGGGQGDAAIVRTL
jgi:acetyl-CoA C-acetyltransferase